jgi:hypothetical protein
MTNQDTSPSTAVRSRPATSQRRRTALILTVCLVSFLGVACLETGIRLFLPVTDMYFTFWDPMLGPRIAPNQSGRNIRGNTFNARFHFNNQGWNHNDNYQLPKPRGSRRICLIGDSQVESLQVDIDKTMFSIAAARMNRPERPVEWYAFANSGWGTNMDYECLRHYVIDYKPDVVVLLFIQNDPFDCSPYLVDVGTLRPVYYLDDHEDLVLIPPASTWTPPLKIRIASNSALVRYFMFQKRLYDRMQGAAELRPGIGGLPLLADSQSSSIGGIPGLKSISQDDRGRMTWKLIERLLTACRDECNTHGAVFAVAFRGWMPEIDAAWLGTPFKPSDSGNDPYCLGDRVSEMGREIVGPMTRRLGIPYLDLTSSLKDMVARTGQSHVFVEDRRYVDHHYNAHSHEAVGGALADWVEGILSKTSSPPTTQSSNPVRPVSDVRPH